MRRRLEESFGSKVVHGVPWMY